MSLYSSFQTHLQVSRLIKSKQKVFVACSGGPDSVALFHLLHGLKDELSLDLGLFHINHGLRGKASDTDADFVKELGRRFQVPAYVLKRKVSTAGKFKKQSLEEAAREIRYIALAELAKKYKVRFVATAHTQDDQAETVLMRVIQGTGLRGLCGIRTSVKLNSVNYVRPLLAFTKEELAQFLKEHKFKFRKDKSNLSRKFLRNKIRLDLLPQLKEDFNPQVSIALARLSSIAEKETFFLDQAENDAWKIVRTFRGKGRCYLERAGFARLPSALQYKVLDRALKTVHSRSGLSFDAWSRLQPHLVKKTYRCHLPRTIEFALTPDRIEVTRENSAK